MSTVQEIKAAIQRLSTAERQDLIAELARLLPELDGDAAWERIISESRPRPRLTELLDRVEIECQRDPTKLTETSEAEFDRHS